MSRKPFLGKQQNGSATENGARASLERLLKEAASGKPLPERITIDFKNRLRLTIEIPRD